MQRYLRILSDGRQAFLAAVTLAMLLAGCGGTQPMAPAGGVLRPEFVITLKLTEGDTPDLVAERFGGRVMVWEDGVYAIVGTDTAPQESSMGDDAVIEANRDVFLGGGEAAWMNGSSQLWAGGRSSLWAGGRSSLWAGGASTLWAGGEFSWMPENTDTWRQIRLQEGQELAPNLGYGVKVAVIDTGVDLNHPGLQEALAPKSEWYDFYEDDAVPQEEGTQGKGGYGHGTNVAGIIRQIAPRATILPIRVLGPDGQGDVAHLAAAIKWAVEKGANIIHLSLGSESSVYAVEQAILQATSQGVLVVASTGNTADTRVTWPASSAADKALGKQRLSVTSVDGHDQKSSFATYGSSVELAAPGENVYGPAPELGLAAWSGTSMAAPMASGALALALGEQLKVPAASLADSLKNYGGYLYKDGLNSEYRGQVGKKRLDVEAFLRKVVDCKGTGDHDDDDDDDD